MNRSIMVILNPSARSNRARSLESRIRALAGDAAVECTRSPEQTREVAREAATGGFRTVVAAGGDGTVNAVANGIAGTGAALGILPVGTMNVFAAELGLPQGRLAAAWRVVERGKVREIDMPRAGSHRFVQLAGAGLDAEVVRLTAPEAKVALGPLSYLLTLAQVAGRKPPEIRLRPSEGGERRARFVLVGNGRYYGGPFVLFKDARPDDGLLDVLAFQNQSPWDILRYFQAVAFGAHPRLPDVEYFQTRSLKLEADSPVPFELDGELMGELPVRFSFSRAKLRVVVPAAPVRQPAAARLPAAAHAKERRHV